MKFSTVQRLGGVSISIGATLLALWTICWTFLLPVNERFRDPSLVVLDSNWIWISSLSLFGIIFMIFGFMAVYTRIYDKVGVTGLMGYFFVIVAYIFQAAKVTWELFVYPVLVGNSSSIFLLKEKALSLSTEVTVFKWLASMTIFIGVLLFCISLIRSKEFPKIAGYFILFGAILYGTGPLINIYLAIIGVVILSIGCYFLGYRMLIEKKNDIVVMPETT